LCFNKLNIHRKKLWYQYTRTNY